MKTKLGKNTRRIWFKYHHNFDLKLTGLRINEKFPQLGATADGLIFCDCYVHGILEIKCPHKYKDGFEKCENDKNFSVDLNSSIKINREYYYQIQGQMLVLVYILMKNFPS